MSRIGKKSIPVPAEVTVSVNDRRVTVRGPRGELSWEVPLSIGVEMIGRELVIAPRASSKKTAALWGLSRALVANMVEGVQKGFEKKLELEGIGYRVSADGSGLLLQLGFSHPVKFPAPEGIGFQVERNLITVSGIDKAQVGEVAARIRALKPPEPYKGKGIRYRGEAVRRKAGKKSGASTS